MCATDIDILAARVEAILPDSIARRLQLSILADSLAYVHTRDAAICLIHVLSDRIRLFAGRLIVLTLEGNRGVGDNRWYQAVDHHRGCGRGNGVQAHTRNIRGLPQAMVTTVPCRMLGKTGSIFRNPTLPIWSE